MSLKEKNDVISIPNHSLAEIFENFLVFPYFSYTLCSELKMRLLNIYLYINLNVILGLHFFGKIGRY